MSRPRISRVINRWLYLRKQGVPAGSQTREMVTMREQLLRIGEWKIVYEETRCER